jgi:hypothetical protein
MPGVASRGVQRALLPTAEHRQSHALAIGAKTQIDQPLETARNKMSLVVVWFWNAMMTIASGIRITAATYRNRALITRHVRTFRYFQA